ncbi:MAG: serine--tRNA ligase [Parcubacteria group bacterium]
MLDIKFIRENKEAMKKTIENKGLDLDLEYFFGIDDQRAKLMQEIEELNALKNDINALVQEAKSEEERKEVIEKGKEIKNKLEAKEAAYKNIKEEFDGLAVKIPTIQSPDTPIGKSDADNMEVYHWGEKTKMDFAPKTHIEIGKNLDILDLERGAKVGGYRGYYVKSEGVSLMMGFMMYAINKMVEKGYAPMLVPTLVKEFALFGSGYFKGLEYNPEIDEIYQVASSDKEADGKASKDKKFLVGTAEPSLLAYYSGEVLDEARLPMKLCGYSQCYRSEIGSYGKETKGLYRVHEFMKVEQVVLCKADIGEAEKFQEEMIGISKEMHEELGIPYRQIIICTGDLGAGKYRQYDLEAWLPGMGRYGETGSASIFLDWQARRLNVKYKDKDGNKKYVYMLNNTALPSPRIFIAILENYQQADGSVKIPEVLQKYMPGNIDVIKSKK